MSVPMESDHKLFGFTISSRPLDGSSEMSYELTTLTSIPNFRQFLADFLWITFQNIV